MFKALMLEKDDAGFRAAVRRRRRSRPARGRRARCSVEHSTLNYKDALAITEQEPDRAQLADGRRHRRRRHGARSRAIRHWKAGDEVVHNGWGVGETRWGCLAERARLKGDWLVALPSAFSTRQAMAIGTAGYTAMLARPRARAARRQARRRRRCSSPARAAASAASRSRCSRRLGHRVAAATGRPQEAAYLRELGAAEVDRSRRARRARQAAAEGALGRRRSMRSAATPSSTRSRRRATAASSRPAASPRASTCRRP